jgi:hypothetical protein
MFPLSFSQSMTDISLKKPAYSGTFRDSCGGAQVNDKTGTPFTEL